MNNKNYLSHLGIFQHIRVVLQYSLPLDHPVMSIIKRCEWVKNKKYGENRETQTFQVFINLWILPVWHILILFIFARLKFTSYSYSYLYKCWLPESIPILICGKPYNSLNTPLPMLNSGAVSWTWVPASASLHLLIPHTHLHSSTNTLLLLLLLHLLLPLLLLPVFSFNFFSSFFVSSQLHLFCLQFQGSTNWRYGWLFPMQLMWLQPIVLVGCVKNILRGLARYGHHMVATALKKV